MAPYLAQLLEDPYDAVRFIAYRSLRSLPHFQDFQYDFVDEREAHSLARLAALDIWNRTRGDQSYPKGGKVLINPDGSPQQDLWDYLLKQRDDRPISLGE